MNIRKIFAALMAAFISMALVACNPTPDPVVPDDDKEQTDENPDKEEPGKEEEDEPKDPVAALELDGYAIFFVDRTSWGATHIYGWNSADGSVTNGWPGNAVTGTVDINEVTYKYVDMGKSRNDKTMKLIFNCNSSQNTQDGYEVTMNRHYFFKSTDDSAEEIDPYFSEEAGEAFTLSATSASFESLPTGGKSLTLSAKDYDWTIDFAGNDWLVMVDENGEKVTSGEKSGKAQYLTLYAAPNGLKTKREGKFTLSSSDNSQ